MSTTKSTALLDLLREHEACREAVEWAKDYPDLQAAWDACERADWMLWLYAKIGDRKKLVLAACACAETAMPVWEKYDANDRRPQECIRIARLWAEGKATDAEMTEAAARAARAAWAARAAEAAEAARAAWAAWAAEAAWAARAAEAARAAGAAGAATQKQMAMLVRQVIPNPEAKP